MSGGAIELSSSRDIQVTNPADGSIIGFVPDMNDQDLKNTVQIAQEAFLSWSVSDMVDRGKILFHAAELVRLRVHDLASLLTQEQGKPLRESRNEISGFARILEYYASISGMIRGEYSSSSLYGHSLVTRHPLGVCGAIIPWNMPVLIMGWKIGPALVTGNTMILKPSSSAPLTCTRLAGILHEAGLADGVLSLVTGKGEIIGEAMAVHPDISALSFTGEVSTGIRVSTLAAPSMKKLVLELGGSDAMIVCDDADLDKAAAGAVSGRFFNCGQTCTAVKRLLVSEKIAEPFIQRVESKIKSLKVSNGLDPHSDIGPVHTFVQRDRILDQISRTVSKDLGILRFGGDVPMGTDLQKGSYLNPALMTGLSPEAPVVREEVFGPVLPVMIYDTLDDAIQIANDTKYGLGASVWSRDIRTIQTACQNLKTGIVWVNQHLKIPPEVPFGGVKMSGFGRENGIRALDHYLEEKTILIKSE